MSWQYLTADRLQMHRWTRKRRLKFRKRWRKQHNGMKFRWFISEPLYAMKPELEEHQNCLFFQRHDEEKFSPFVKA